MSQKTEVQAQVNRSHFPEECLTTEKAPVSTTCVSEKPESIEKASLGANGEETEKPRPVADSLPMAVVITIFIQGVERFAYYALTGPWQNYIQNPPGDYALPGALGLGQSRATAINNAFYFVSFLTPLFMGIISDTWLGRYKTLVLSLSLASFGALTLTLTSLPMALERGAGPPGLVVSMLFIACGVGGVKANLPPFLGDQYVQEEPRRIEKKDGQVMVTDKTLTLQLIYGVAFWATNLASMSIIPATFLEKKFGFWTAYLLGLAPVVTSLILLLCFSSKLVKIPPRGNMLLQASKMVVCAAKNGFKMNNAKASYQASHHGKTVPWTDEFVDEVKITLRTCRILLSLAIFSLCMGQILNNLVSQAGQMELHGVPNDMIQAFSGIAVVLLIPLIQGLYSLLAKHNIILGPMFKIALAFMFTAAGMAFSAGVQQLIYSAGPCYNSPLACEASMGGTVPNRVNIWVQTPVHFLLGAGEILGYVTVDQYAYTNSPEGGKAVVQAFKQLAHGLGSILGLAISPVARDPNLVVLYASLAATMVVATGIFWFFFGKHDRPKQEDGENSN